MKLFLVIYLSVCMVACGQHKQPVEPAGHGDTVKKDINLADPFMDSLHKAHALLDVEMRDSLFAIKPLVVFNTDAAGDCLNKMISAFIDTNDVAKTLMPFTDTTIYERDKKENILTHRQILKNKQFVVEIFGPDEQNSALRKLIINGRELRSGIELDTSLVGIWWPTEIVLNAEQIYFLKFGAKEYLFLEAHFQRCTGSGCAVVYYILYDPSIRQAMIFQQFRQDFIPGFDKKTNSPVFMYMDAYAGYSEQLTCYIYSGSVYRFARNGKLKIMVDKKGQPLHYYAYHRNEGDSLVLIQGNPVFLAK